MKFVKFFTVIIFLFGKSFSTIAQDNFLSCKTDVMVKKSLHDHPELALNQQQLEIATQQYLQHPDEKQIYVIPVVFHIIHEYGAENISDAQVLDEMRVINEDYSLTNADASNIVSAFTGIAANCGFSFKLANKDPQGNCTNGIERIVSSLTNNADDNSKLDPWPSDMYLNIWVVKSIPDAAAYAYLPGTAPNDADGILCRFDYVGSIGTSNSTKSHTLSHETGHFLNLKHTWGNTNSPGVSCGNDNVSDTPQTEGWTSCNLSGATCGSALDNVQNFMEYSYCSCMFTSGQKSRMIAALTSGWGGRNNLWNSANLLLTGVSGTQVLCAPIADFINGASFICEGSTVQYVDISSNGTVSTRQWTINGGVSSSLSDSIINVTYNTAGTYGVTLSVSNASGSDIITKNAVVIVIPATAMYSNGYAEDFENDVIPENDWTPLNIGSSTFTISTNAHHTGAKSLAYINSASFIGNVSEAVGPTLDMTTISNPLLTFYVAYSQRVSTDADILRMYVSTDCGKTWSLRFVKSGASLSTVSNPLTAPFYPSSQSNWRMETVALNSYITASNLRIKFQFISQGGNNLFIDDINMGGYSFSDFPFSVSGLQLYPNPASNQITVQSIDGNTPLKFTIIDETGRIISQLLPQQSLSTINIKSFDAGVYFIKVKMIDGSILVRKFVKE